MEQLDPTDWAVLVTPVVAFIALIWVARADLGFKGIGIFFVICAALLLAVLAVGLPIPYFIAAMAIIDIILVLIAFGGDFSIT